MTGAIAKLFATLDRSVVRAHMGSQKADTKTMAASTSLIAFLIGALAAICLATDR